MIQKGSGRERRASSSRPVLCRIAERRAWPDQPDTGAREWRTVERQKQGQSRSTSDATVHGEIP
jgi:hypothetical protein